jgi:prophage DNA circulation protein
MNLLEEQMRKLAQLAEEQAQAIQQAVLSTKELESRVGEEQRVTTELREQIEALRTKAGTSASQAAAQISALQARLTEEQRRATDGEEQGRALRADMANTANQGTARVANLEAKLAEEKRKSAQLTERIAQLEPFVAYVDRLQQAITEISKLSTKRSSA